MDLVVVLAGSRALDSVHESLLEELSRDARRVALLLATPDDVRLLLHADKHVLSVADQCDATTGTFRATAPLGDVEPLLFQPLRSEHLPWVVETMRQARAEKYAQPHGTAVPAARMAIRVAARVNPRLHQARVLIVDDAYERGVPELRRATLAVRLEQNRMVSPVPIGYLLCGGEASARTFAEAVGTRCWYAADPSVCEDPLDELLEFASLPDAAAEAGTGGITWARAWRRLRLRAGSGHRQLQAMLHSSIAGAWAAGRRSDALAACGLSSATNDLVGVHVYRSTEDRAAVTLWDPYAEGGIALGPDFAFVTAAAPWCALAASGLWDVEETDRELPEDATEDQTRLFALAGWATDADRARVRDPALAWIAWPRFPAEAMNISSSTRIAQALAQAAGTPARWNERGFVVGALAGLLAGWAFGEEDDDDVAATPLVRSLFRGLCMVVPRTLAEQVHSFLLDPADGAPRFVDAVGSPEALAVWIAVVLGFHDVVAWTQRRQQAMHAFLRQRSKERMEELTRDAGLGGDADKDRLTQADVRADIMRARKLIAPPRRGTRLHRLVEREVKEEYRRRVAARSEILTSAAAAEAEREGRDVEKVREETRKRVTTLRGDAALLREGLSERVDEELKPMVSTECYDHEADLDYERRVPEDLIVEDPTRVLPWAWTLLRYATRDAARADALLARAVGLARALREAPCPWLGSADAPAATAVEIPARAARERVLEAVDLREVPTAADLERALAAEDALPLTRPLDELRAEDAAVREAARDLMVAARGGARERADA